MSAYIVTFDTQGHGVAPSSQTLTVLLPSDSQYPSGNVYPMTAPRAVQPADPEATGYRFTGWYRDTACTLLWDFNNYVSSSMTLYAGWKVIAVDLHGNRHNEKFTYKRVAWTNWQEHENYDFITGGNIEYATDAELKVTGSFDIDGYDIPNVNDLVRVYYSFRDDDGEVGEYPLATLFMNYASVSYIDTLKGVKAGGSLEGSSVLKVLQEKQIGVPMSFASGSNAVYEAQKLIQSVGLNVEAEPSSIELSTAQTFDSGTTYLEIVNTLCDLADFAEVCPDAYGTVQLRSKVSNRIGAVSHTFRNDNKSIMYPEIAQDNDWQNTPNVVRLLYNNDSECVAAWAINQSGSRSSLDARGGREITYFESVSNVGDGTTADILMQKAKEMLVDKSADIEYVTIEHAYVPIGLYELIGIEYSTMNWQGNVDNISIDLAPSVHTQTKIKRTAYANIVVETDCSIYREAE